MAKLNVKKSFNDKKFKYGGYATLMTAVVIAIIIIANLVVGQLSLKADLTTEKVLSISDETKNIVKKLNKQIEIIGLYQASNTSANNVPTADIIKTRQIIDKFGIISKNVKVSYIDPILHPEFAKSSDFKSSDELTQNSVIVKCGKKYKVIQETDLYDITQDQNTGGSQITGSLAEQKITAAIMYVAEDKDSTVYVLQGHEEQAISSDVQKILTDANYTVQDINILQKPLNPDPANILIINTPTKDISQQEDTKLKDYLDKGGRILFFEDWVTSATPNLDDLLNYYGVKSEKAYILEGDNSYAVQRADYLIPEFQSQDIVNPLSSANRKAIIMGAVPITEAKVKKSTLKIEPLLKTSDKAYAKTNAKSQVTSKESGDLSGPFNVGVAVTNVVDSGNTNKNGKLVIYGAPIGVILDSNAVQYSSETNKDLILNSLGWLADKEDNITVRPKSYAVEPLTITEGQQFTVSVVAIFVIPAVIGIAGIFVCLRRRSL